MLSAEPCQGLADAGYSALVQAFLRALGRRSGQRARGLVHPSKV